RPGAGPVAAGPVDRRPGRRDRPVPHVPGHGGGGAVGALRGGGLPRGDARRRGRRVPRHRDGRPLHRAEGCMSVLDWASAVLVVVGAALGAVGGLGLVRLPDVFARMHAATKAPTMGLVLVVLAAALQVADAADLGLLALVVMLQFLTAPVGAHLIGRAAYDAGG